MQVAILYYRMLDGHPWHNPGHPDIDPISAPWGELVETRPRHEIDFDAAVDQEYHDQMHLLRYPVEDPEKLPQVDITPIPCQWPVLKQAKVGRVILTLVDDGSW